PHHIDASGNTQKNAEEGRACVILDGCLIGKELRYIGQNKAICYALEPPSQDTLVGSCNRCPGFLIALNDCDGRFDNLFNEWLNQDVTKPIDNSFLVFV